MINRILTGDCLEIMPTLPRFDVIITDPPYLFKKGKPKGGGFYIPEYMNCFNKITATYGTKFNPTPFLETVKQVMDPVNLYVWCNIGLLATYLNFAAANKYAVDIIFWEKSNATPTHGGHYKVDKEYCVFMRGKGAYYYSKNPTDNYRTIIHHSIGFKKETEHPNEKPQELFWRAIENSCPPGGIMLDPYCGSGSSCLTAKNHGRRYIGIELFPHYAGMAMNRLDVRQLEIFGGAA